MLQAKVGLHFILKGRIWQMEKIADDRKIYVTSVEDPLAAVPGWDGEMLPVPYGLAQRSGELRRRVGALVSGSSPEAAARALSEELPVTEPAMKLVADDDRRARQDGRPSPVRRPHPSGGVAEVPRGPLVLRGEGQPPPRVHLRGGALEEGAHQALVHGRIQDTHRADHGRRGARPQAALEGPLRDDAEAVRGDLRGRRPEELPLPHAGEAGRREVRGAPQGPVHRAPQPLLPAHAVREHPHLRGGGPGDREGHDRHAQGEGAPPEGGERARSRSRPSSPRRGPPR